ncbi:hypothetical protein [Vibrio sp. Vb339]|uniref:hypothetical protein n=1 Tax=Vibrio sp. Vb339 TaxID=1192013 RepID=UPI0015519EF4|nr:hypothetical protein [Vibrio sp. Vb339]
MFSKKAVNPYDFMSHAPTPQTIRNRIGVIRNHFEFNEKLNLDDRRQLLEQIENSDHEVEREHYEIELHFHEHFFERVHRISTLLLLYSLLENLMAHICKYKAQLNKQDFLIPNHTILAYKSFLTKSLGVKFGAPEIEKNWAIIKRFNRVRNALAHSEGDIKQYRVTSPDKIETLINDINHYDGLSIYSNTIMINKDYVNLNINAVESLLLAIQNN